MNTATQTTPPLSQEEMSSALAARDVRRMQHARTKLAAHGFAMSQFGATPDDLVISKGRSIRQRCVGLDEIEAFMRAELGSV